MISLRMSVYRTARYGTEHACCAERTVCSVALGSSTPVRRDVTRRFFNLLRPAHSKRPALADQVFRGTRLNAWRTVLACHRGLRSRPCKVGRGVGCWKSGKARPSHAPQTFFSRLVFEMTRRRWWTDAVHVTTRRGGLLEAVQNG